MVETPTIYPVVLRVDPSLNGLRGADRVAMLSSMARLAARLSADMGGFSVGELAKDAGDVPIPSNGYHWSVSHKSKYVAGVVAPHRIAIDVEEIVPRSKGVLDYVATPQEWELAGDRSWHTFFRLWTAKEAVIKGTGAGLADLRKCQVFAIDAGIVELELNGELYQVEQVEFDGHIAAMLRQENSNWTIAPYPEPAGGIRLC